MSLSANSAKVAPLSKVSTPDPKTEFMDAVKKGECETPLRLIQDKKINPSIRDNEAIKIACTKGISFIILGFIDLAIILLQDARVDPGIVKLI